MNFFHHVQSIFQLLSFIELLVLTLLIVPSSLPGRGLGQQCGDYISWLTAKVTAPNTATLSFLLKTAGYTADIDGRCGPGQ